MDTYKELRARGFHSLAAAYKIRRKFFNDPDGSLNPAETYTLMNSPVFSYREIDYALDRLHDPDQLDVAHTLDTQTLTLLNSMCKNVLKNPASWRFVSHWTWYKSLCHEPGMRLAREWFQHIATMNPDSEIGSRASKAVRIIDRRLDVQG